MKFFYDMHIHSDLSPCGDSDMTPNNIVNMAKIKGLDIISVTDHNTAENLPAVRELCKDADILFIPGIEVTTKEEVHVLCYFKELEEALKFGRIIYDSLPNVQNIPSIFGNQNIYNKFDEVTHVLDKLLINASSYSLKDICLMAVKHEGIAVPAHVNKKSNSIMSVLGFMPADLNLSFVEVHPCSAVAPHVIKGLNVLRNSDAHCLTDISEAVNFFELKSADEIYDYLKL